MPRIVVKQADLPAATLDGALVVRFKIVSNSRNSMSEWSPAFHIYPPVYDPEDYDGNSFYDQGEVSSMSIVSARVADDPVRWNIALNWQDSYGLPQYDLYVRWYFGATVTDWTFMDSLATKSYAFDSPMVYDVTGLIQTVPTAVDIAVTRSTYIKRYVLPELPLTKTPLTVFNTVGHEHDLTMV
jgi:hypothetical protein